MNNYMSKNSKKYSETHAAREFFFFLFSMELGQKNKIQTQPNKRTKFAKHGVKDEQRGEIFKFFFCKRKRIFLP
jgi:hypothetical protein